MARRRLGEPLMVPINPETGELISNPIERYGSQLDETGKYLRYYEYRTPGYIFKRAEMREAFTFSDILTFDNFRAHKPPSATFRDTSGKTWLMFLNDFSKTIKKLKNGKLNGEFRTVKRYGYFCVVMEN